MTTLLKIDSSASGDNSASRKLANEFVAHWLEKNPQGTVVTRDVNANPLPHLTSDTLAALFTPAEQRSEEQKAIVALADSLIDEIEAADVVAISAPMYNFAIPSTLKAYFDYIARAGRTFKYTQEGPVGLLTKPVYLFVASGSFVAGTPMDNQVPYLKTFLGFLGMNVVDTYIAGGQAMGEEGQKAFESAKSAIADAF